MATEEAERGPGSSAVGHAHVTSPPTAPAPSHGGPWNLPGEGRPRGSCRNSDQLLWSPASTVCCNHGDTRRRPSAVSYRTLSYDHGSSKGEGSFLDGERAAVRLPPVHGPAEQSMKGVSRGVGRLARRGPESPLGHSDLHDDDDDEAWASASRIAGSARCACPASRLHANCNHSPGSNQNRRSNVSTKSTMSPAYSPPANPSPRPNVSPAVGGCRANTRLRARPTQHIHRHARRSSLPAFMLASHKVITRARSGLADTVKENSIGY